MFGSNVQPRRRLREKRDPWECECRGETISADGMLEVHVTDTDPPRIKRREHPAYLTRCPDCGEKRP